MKALLKNCLNGFCLVLVLPLAALSWLEKKSHPTSEVVYSFFAQFLACMPGLPGVFVRRAYYFLTTQQCSLHSVIGFGSILVHRRTVIDANVSIGNYAVIGTARIESGCEIGSRVSITSGKNQHILSVNEKWSPFDFATAPQIIIENNVWIGEGAIVMAGIGKGTLVGAGTVVVEEVPERVVVAGNPARIIRKLQVNSD